MSLLTRTDVTAVNLFQNLIIAGIGSTLEAFKRDSGKFIQRLSVLQGQKVYGIVPSRYDSQVLIFGGKQFAILQVQNDTTDAEKYVMRHHVLPIICDDWLHSGSWMSNNTVALLTAHNVVQIWNTETQSLEEKYQGPDNCLLYSGFLLPLQDDILIFSGTAVSEVIIHWYKDDTPLKRLKGHKGVIFSVTCNPQKGIIVTTSDDRSVIIWNVKNLLNLEYKCKDYWLTADISCSHQLYGHSGRVMRNCITSDYIISIGENSDICFWNHEGKLLKKILAHQNGSLWSLDADDEHLVTGGSDGSLIIHPLSLLTDYGNSEIVEMKLGSPKQVDFTARGNIVVMSESNDLVFQELSTKRTEVYKLNHKSTYKFLCLSSCKQIIAVADMTGSLAVFIENCKGDAEIKRIINTKMDLGNILSMQWADNRHLVLCSENGVITVLASKEKDVEVYAKFSLPSCKERWLTASALSPDERMFVVSDRCGHMHVYIHSCLNPVQTFHKVHGPYGATTITIRDSKIVTTGRDGTMKYFSVSKHSTKDLKYMSCKNLEFQWVEKFLDNSENYICGFQEREFIVYDIRNNMKVLEVNCGGGHRSWDAIRCFDKIDNDMQECIKLMYIKNSNIHLDTFQLSKIVSRHIINGSHSREIHCLKTHLLDNDEDRTFYISGGEDTTLRISSSTLDSEFRDEVIFKQLSNVRTLKLLPMKQNCLLLISAGGRAQICAKTVSFNNQSNTTGICTEQLVDYLIKGIDKERKHNRNWRNCSVDFDPETRIMDIGLTDIDDHKFLIFAGCSDGELWVFELENTAKIDFKPVKKMKAHNTCILITHVFQFNGKEILATFSTRGEVAFWDTMKFRTESSPEPVFTIKTMHKSYGINCADIKVINETRFLLATGGDDNAIYLNTIQIENDDLRAMKLVHTWSSDRYHCSQIRGIKLIDDLMVSASVDQRVTLIKVTVAESIGCDFVSQHFTDIADIHGLDIISCSKDFLKICAYGKGIEVLQLSRGTKK